MVNIKEGLYRKGGIRSKPSTSKPDFVPPPQKVKGLRKRIKDK